MIPRWMRWVVCFAGFKRVALLSDRLPGACIAISASVSLAQSPLPPSPPVWQELANFVHDLERMPSPEDLPASGGAEPPSPLLVAGNEEEADVPVSLAVIPLCRADKRQHWLGDALQPGRIAHPHVLTL